jgi:hypothetical protein
MRDKVKQAIYYKEYYKRNRERRKEYLKKNKEKIAKQMKAHHKKNRDKIAKWIKEYKEKNREKIAEHTRKYKEKNKEKIAIQRRKYKEKNKEKMKEGYHLLHLYGSAKQNDTLKKQAALIRIGKRIFDSRVGSINKRKIPAIINRIEKGETYAAYE